jgi:DNA-binding cell septation regulator SpoVG
VSDVHLFDDGNITFRLHYGRCTIYGCRIANGENGEFIAFPSRKVEGKRRGDPPRYYSHAFIPLDEDEQAEIIQIVYDESGIDQSGRD